MQSKALLLGFSLLLASAALLTPAASLAANFGIVWEYPSDVLGLTGFRIYYGAQSKATLKEPLGDGTPKPYEKMLDVNNPQAREATITTTTPGALFFRATAIMKDAASGQVVESDFSNEAMGVLKPPAPAIVRIK